MLPGRVPNASVRPLSGPSSFLIAQRSGDAAPSVDKEGIYLSDVETFEPSQPGQAEQDEAARSKDLLSPGSCCISQ